MMEEVNTKKVSYLLTLSHPRPPRDHLINKRQIREYEY